MKNTNCSTLALALLTLALAASQIRAQNHVVNGSFEMPAHPGNGDIYQTDAGFSLPGWGTSGSSNLFVEYGVHVLDQLPPHGLYTINVFTGLRITSVAKAGADLQLNFTSQVGHNYTVESFVYLENGVIRDVATGIPGNGSIVQTTVSNAFVYPQQFFRVKQEPAQ